MSNRRSIFRAQKRTRKQRHPVESSVPLRLFMDESGNGNADQPLIVGAVACDLEADALEARIEALYKRLVARTSFEGLESFQKFLADGFHATADPPEIKRIMFELIQEVVGLKVYATFTDRTSFKGSSDRKIITTLYADLVADTMIRYRHHPAIECYVEQNDDLKHLPRDLPLQAEERAKVKLEREARFPPVTVRMVAKKSLMSIALIDYVMFPISRWVRKRQKRDPSDLDYRAFREVEPTISFLRSVEAGAISSRKIRHTD